MEHPQMNPTPTPNSDPLGPKLDGRAALERSLEKLDSPTPNSTAPVDTTVDLIQIRICRACRDGIGSECHTPECALFLHKVDLPIDPNLYEVVPEKSDSQSVDIARLRELYHNAVDGPILIRVSSAYRSNGDMLASFAFSSEAILYAALRNEAPALLDEVERLRHQIKKPRSCDTDEINELKSERDSLRQQNARLIAEIEELKAKLSKGDA